MPEVAWSAATEDARPAGVMLYVRALRLPFVTVSGTAYVYGVALAGGGLPVLPVLLGLAAVILGHLGGNLANDFADSRTGADERDPRYFGFFGGSKLIQRGTLSRGFYLRAAAGCTLASGLCVVGVALLHDSLLAPAAFAAVAALAWSYSCRPLRLAYRRMGEALVFLLFGPATVAAGAFCRAGRVPGWPVWLMSATPGLLTAAVLVANEVPDAPDDDAVGKRHLVNAVGPSRGWMLFAASVAAAYAVVAAGIASGAVGLLALASLAALAPAAVAIRTLRGRWSEKRALTRSSRAAIAVHAVATAALILDAWLMRG